MSYAVFTVKNEDADAVQGLYEDDLVGRQSITVREAESLDVADAPDADADVRYVVVEGSDEAVEKAGELLGDAGERLEDEVAALVFEAIKEAEEAGAAGMGMIFGGD